MIRSIKPSFIALTLVFAGSTNTLTASPVDIVFLDGSSATMEIHSIDADGRVIGEGLPENLTLDGVRSIQRPEVSAQPKDVPVVIELVGDATVRAQALTISNEMCQVKLASSTEVAIPIDVVRAIRFEPNTKHSQFEDAFASRGVSDRMFVRVDDQILPLSGLIESLTDDEVAFDVDGDTVKFSRDKLHGIVLASLGGDPLEDLPVTVALRDGSSLHGTGVTLNGGTLQLEVSESSEAGIAWDSVIAIRVRSDRLVFLSDLTPADAEQQTIVTLNQPWQRDLSVGKRPLTLAYNDGRDARTFNKGLGTHARCRLTYETAGAYKTFEATIGIDAETNGRGDCEFVVIGDGKELYRQRVAGKDEPRDVSVDITGIEKVTLLVEPGVDLDLADHADWCDARFIRE